MKRLTGAWQTMLAVLLTVGAAIGLPLVTPDTGLEAPAASATASNSTSSDSSDQVAASSCC